MFEQLFYRAVGVSSDSRYPFFQATLIAGITGEAIPYRGFIASWWSPDLQGYVKYSNGTVMVGDRVLTTIEREAELARVVAILKAN
jgi:hypothetical protein